MDFKYYVDYFSMLEERLYNMKRYIAFEEENLNTFSIELASIINDCCGLINGFCTELCQEKQKKVEGKTKTKFDIRDYKKMLQQGDYLIETLVYVGKFKIQPWEDCVVNKTNNVNINWWKAYNSIKHSGKPNFSQATLKNTFSCMAGMFALLTMYDFKIMTNTMVNWRRLFSYAGNYYNNVSWKCN